MYHQTFDCTLTIKILSEFSPKNHFVIVALKEFVRPGQFQTGPLGLGPVIEESLGSPAKQEQGSQSDRVRTENKRQYSPGNTQNGVLSRAGLM